MLKWLSSGGVNHGVLLLDSFPNIQLSVMAQNYLGTVPLNRKKSLHEMKYWNICQNCMTLLREISIILSIRSIFKFVLFWKTMDAHIYQYTFAMYETAQGGAPMVHRYDWQLCVSYLATGEMQHMKNICACISWCIIWNRNIAEPSKICGSIHFLPLEKLPKQSYHDNYVVFFHKQMPSVNFCRPWEVWNT